MPTTAKKRNTVAAPPSTVDITEDANKPEAKPEDLKSIMNLAREMYKLEVELNILAEQAKKKSDRFNEIRQTLLPERMSSCGMESFQLTNGYAVEIKKFITASIPTQNQIAEAEGMDRIALMARRKLAMAWLRKHKADSLIKNKLSVEFGKGEDKAAKKFVEQIQKAGYPARCEESVNFQTLGAFIREQLEKGVEVPSEPFALFNGKVAKITQQKGKK